MSFGWSAGDVVAALQLLNKVRIALQDAGGAKSDYQEEAAFLDTVSTNLHALSTIDNGTLFPPEVGENIRKHALSIKGPVDEFLDSIRSSFGSTLGGFPTRPGVLSPARKLQWSLSTSKKVKALRLRIHEPLSLLQICLSGHIL